MLQERLIPRKNGGDIRFCFFRTQVLLAVLFMITVEQALETILAHISVLGTERVDILASRGRVLSEDIISILNVPPLDNSSMDGYAVRANDVLGAAPDHPRALTVVGDLPAGYTAQEPLQPGEALRIMTGAPIPEGADTVIMQENTRARGLAGYDPAGRKARNQCTARRRGY